MPFRPGVDDNEPLKNLIQAWIDGESDIASRQDAVFQAIQAELHGVTDAVRLDRLRIQAKRLEELRGVTVAVVDDLAQASHEFLMGTGFDRIYASGASLSAPFSFTLPHRAAVDVLAQDAFDDVLVMTDHVDTASKAFVRRIGRQLTGFKLTGGEPVKAQARRLASDLKSEFGTRGITAITYADGSRHGFGEYSEMLLRTKTGVAYNTGTLNQGLAAGIRWYEILDGAECGLTTHYDPQLANGLIVPFEIAQAFPLAHPACRRALNPRPDVTKGDLDAGKVRSIQSEESRADQAGFEAFLRAGGRAQDAPAQFGGGSGPKAPLTGSGALRGPLTGSKRQSPLVSPAAARAREAGRAAAQTVTRAQARADALTVAQQERLVTARNAARSAGFRGKVDPAVLERWGVNEEQFLNARALVGGIKADVRAVSTKEADALGAWLDDSDLATLSRPARLVRQADIGGRVRSVRTQSGYDFLETLSDPETARIRKRMVESDLFSPDVLAERVRAKTNLDLSDDEAMNWLVDRWLHEDALRSLASGRIPKYSDLNNLIPADQANEGYDLARLFGVDADDAAGHVASVQADAGKRFAEQALGVPEAGPAPWSMEFGAYLRELEQVEQILSSTQIAEGVDGGQAFAYARARIRELAPAALDPTGSLNPADLFEAIRITAQTAGLATA